MGFYAVADGVGSTPGSAAASVFAVQRSHELFLEAVAAQRQADLDLVALANAVFEDFSTEFAAEPRTPATTLTLLIVGKMTLRYVSMGDSPLFLLEAGRTSLLTRAHTIVDRDRVYSDFTEMKSQPGSNVLANTLGARRPRAIDYADVTLGGDCRLILCTDGMMELFTQNELASLAAPDVSLAAVIDLVRVRARQTSPPDNYTAVIIDVATDGDTDGQ
jgi:serine/threonine protein phosphatase PrpC